MTTLVPAAPNLPLPTQEYSPQYINSLTNILRLFFIPLSGAVQANTNNISSSSVMAWMNM